jgi:hypothetical protein
MTRLDVAADRDPVNDRIGALVEFGRMYVGANAEDGGRRDGCEVAKL